MLRFHLECGEFRIARNIRECQLFFKFSVTNTCHDNLSIGFPLSLAFAVGSIIAIAALQFYVHRYAGSTIISVFFSDQKLSALLGIEISSINLSSVDGEIPQSTRRKTSKVKESLPSPLTRLRPILSKNRPRPDNAFQDHTIFRCWRWCIIIRSGTLTWYADKSVQLTLR